MFWRRKPKDDAPPAEGRAAGRDERRPPTAVPADWEPDPADFDDPPAAVSAPVVAEPASAPLTIDPPIADRSLAEAPVRADP